MAQSQNTQPLVKDGKRLTRRFLGNLFPKTCQETKELKAYIAGHESYSYKMNMDSLPPRKNYYKVRQEYFYV